MSADDTDTVTREYVHVAFDQTVCPIDGCTSLKGGPQKGSVPGIKRHVKMIHGVDVYDKTEFPALRSAEGPIKHSPKETLFKAAQSRGLVGKDSKESKHSKEALIEALATGKALEAKVKAAKEETE